MEISEEKQNVRVSFRSSASLLRKYLKPHWFKVSLLAFLLCVSIGLEVLNPRLLGLFIDSVQSSMQILVGIAMLFIGIVIANQIVTALASYISEDISWRATNQLRVDLVLHCLSLDMSFHKVHTPGELIERVDGDIAQLAEFFSRFVFSVLARVLLLTGIIVLTALVDWRIGLLLLVFALLMLVFLRPLQGIAVPRFRATRQVTADLASFFQERLSSREDIRSLGAQAYVMLRLNQLARRSLQATRRSRVAGRFFSSTIEVSLALAVAALLTLGAYLLRNGQMSLGAIYVTYYYTSLLTQSLYAISFQMDQLQSAVANIQRITELSSTTSAIVEGAGVPLPEEPLSIRFDGVSFGYTQEKKVLKNLSFELQAGKTLGLLGKTGSGKTTLSRLLSRTYDVQEGSIQIGGVPLREVKLSELRSRIGIVTQEVQLFHASIRDNLTFFDPAISDERLEQVIIDLNLAQWYASLPVGLDTIILGDGMALSSGEAQLLAFARVFLQNPDIVILDEASSRLDPVTEKLIERAIVRLLAGRTAIVIAHHLGTVQAVDKIMILEGGTIGEYGDRSELVADPTSKFSHLLQASLEEVLS